MRKGLTRWVERSSGLWLHAATVPSNVSVNTVFVRVEKEKAIIACSFFLSRDQMPPQRVEAL
ncbi:hypothetical protein HK27_08300 [Acetobacter orientalis]|uniref:Uncharacterized protein n=1 Tax=Acetobacter orientalis TaxID=146474 RepID=A0A252C9S5_9PROT|nr:hypothetical protein HK15_11505 [Acetobacter orientalis]OUJ17742.1 hypothetical protein HK27_08300 [Acetobacter orientalis]